MPYKNKDDQSKASKEHYQKYKAYYKSRVKQRYMEHKKKAIEFLGGKCIQCGYSKNISALEFHHKNGDTKDRQLSKLMFCSWDKLKIELEKCILLCANCHREEHHPNWETERWQSG